MVDEDRLLLSESLYVNITPLGSFPITHTDVVEHSGEREIFQDEITRLIEEFRKALRISVEKLGNTAEDTLIGIRNICLNAPWIWNTPVTMLN